MANLRHYTIGLWLFIQMKYNRVKKSYYKFKIKFKEENYGGKLIFASSLVLMIAQLTSAFEYLFSKTKRKKIR